MRVTSAILRSGLVLSTLTIFSGTASASDPSTTLVDPTTGLIIAPGWELVRTHCGACHSYRLVTEQRGDEDFWLSSIRWMQKTQNLWQFAPDQESELISYLATQYNESDWGRRPALSPALRPPAAQP